MGTKVSDEREIIPAGEQPAPWFLHLRPITRFLITERGHMPIEEVEDPEDWGFTQEMDGFECHLTHGITPEDWAAINERFVIPANVVYMFGLIRDQDNNIDIVGHDEITDRDGVIPIDVWEERQRAEGNDFGLSRFPR